MQNEPPKAWSFTDVNIHQCSNLTCIFAFFYFSSSIVMVKYNTNIFCFFEEVRGLCVLIICFLLLVEFSLRILSFSMTRSSHAWRSWYCPSPSISVLLSASEMENNENLYFGPIPEAVFLSWATFNLPSYVHGQSCVLHNTSSMDYLQVPYPKRVPQLNKFVSHLV